jgi:hypothetical protein
MAAACRSSPRPSVKDVVIWKEVGSWSGRGNAQTETFTSDTGGFASVGKPEMKRNRAAAH